MPFPHPPHRLPVLAGLLAAGLVLTVLTAAGCGHVTPLGPDAAPQPSQLGSPIVLQPMSVRLPFPPGKCPAGYAAIPVPGMSPGPCYRKLGTPMTVTSAAVSQPRTPPGQGGPAGPAGLLVTVPADDAAALTAISTRAYDSRGAMDIIVAGKTWALPMAMAPLTHGQFEISLPSSQALQLQHLLTSSG